MTENNIAALDEDEIIEIIQSEKFMLVKPRRNLPLEEIEKESQMLTRALEDFKKAVNEDTESAKYKILRARILLHLFRLKNIANDLLPA
jgi:hypothetical protein